MFSLFMISPTAGVNMPKTVTTIVVSLSQYTEIEVHQRPSEQQYLNYEALKMTCTVALCNQPMANIYCIQYYCHVSMFVLTGSYLQS